MSASNRRATTSASQGAGTSENQGATISPSQGAATSASQEATTSASQGAITSTTQGATADTSQKVYTVEELGKEKVEELLAQGILFKWKKSTVRSPAWDNWLHIFKINGKETRESLVNFVQCQLCSKVFPHNSRTGNQLILDHNKTHTLDESQIPMDAFVTSKDSKDICESDMLELKTMLCHLVAASYSPFTLVEMNELRHLLDFVFNLGKQYYRGCYKLAYPSRRSAKTTILSMANSLRKSMADKIKVTKQQHVSFSADIWSDNSQMNSYMDVSAMLVDNEFKLRSFQLRMDHFPVSHTAENIKQYFLTLANELECNSSSMRIVSDSAANMLAGLRGFENFRCAAHRLHTILSDGNSY